VQKNYRLTTIPSSEYSRVCKLTVRFEGGDREVYIKKYLPGSILHFIKQLFRGTPAARAFEGAGILAKNGFDTPTIVAMGECGLGLCRTRSFLASLEATGSRQISEYITESPGNLTKEQLRAKRELIRAFGQTVGKMHAKGIFHGDLRAGNVLAKQEEDRWRFFFLDNERTKVFRELPVQLQLKNLIQLNMKLPHALTNTDRMRFFKEYWAENGASKHHKTALIKEVLQKTNKRLSKNRLAKRELRKCLRTNERYVRIKTGRHIASFDRAFCRGNEAVELADFIGQIEALIDAGQTLKDDKTCHLSRFTWNGKDIVVKRYNHRGLVHSVRHTIKRSRARRNWLHGHRLRVLDIATPRPLAYIEQRRGMLVWKSYFVTEYVEGPRLYDIFRDNNITQEERLMASQQVTDLVDELGKYKITHGDLKPTNILITYAGPVLTDLDGMKAHTFNWGFKPRRVKDTARLSKKAAISPATRDKAP